MIGLLITSYPQTESQIEEKTTKQLDFRLSSVVAISVLWNYDFELNLYPAQEGLLYC